MRERFFADSCFLTGLMVDGDDHNEDSKDIFEHLQENKLISDTSDLHISNYIIIEVLNNLKGKRVPFAQIRENYEKLKQCQIFHIKQRQIDDAFNEKLAPFINHRTQNPPIGIVDATSLVVMDMKRIGFIISFDTGFDKMPDKFLTRIKDTDVIDQRILRRIY